jgi:hypothetical protein
MFYRIAVIPRISFISPTFQPSLFRACFIGESKRKSLLFLLSILLSGFVGINNTIFAATPGLPFAEDFTETNLRDGTNTTANWTGQEQELFLAWCKAQYGAFPASTVGSDITGDTSDTIAIAFGDIDGDGDLDVVTGNLSQVNRLYLNNGTADPLIKGDRSISRVRFREM